jgi:hypothetical protein
MARWSFLLVAAVAAASFFVEPAIAQFPKINIPKITIPKITKTDPPPSTTTSSDPVSRTSDSSSSSSASPSSSGEVRGKPISGARITFSNSPDGSSPKNSFTSSEYIYGKLDLGGKTVYEAFNLKNQTDVPIYYIHYDLKIYKPGEKPYEGNWGGSFNQTLVTKEEAQKTYWIFDVLPDPSKITTLKSMLANEKDFERKSVAGIYSKYRDADSARSEFPQSGTYLVDVTVWGEAYDDWGKPVIGSDSKPTASAMFSFQFSGTDGQRLVANAEKANKTLETAKIAKEMHRTMPDWWFKGATYPAEPKLSSARLVPMIKEFISQWNLTYVKHMIVKTDGALWTIKKNELGIPTFRDLVPYIYIIYRDPKEDNPCQLGAIYMRQPYAGAGTYGEPFLGGIRDVEYIECSAIK